MTKTYKLNKSELTRLKNEEKIYIQFLPVLKLKQEQLQIEKIRIKKKVLHMQAIFDKKFDIISCNASVLTDKENYYGIDKILTIKNISTNVKSIAGVKVPIIDDIKFNKFSINFFDVPFWLIIIIDDLKDLIKSHLELKILKKQYFLINAELKKATQKVNLFEQLLIPDTKNAIKKIKITLGDEQVASVGRAKIAKKKTINIIG
jgi:V/A-type H+-transporting ATPase subunit D